MRCQINTWAMLSGENQLGQLEKTEFVDKFLPLSRETTLKSRFQEAASWFELMDQDCAGAVTLDNILEFLLQSEQLLQAVIQRRLFVGSIAGGTSTFQLTVRHPRDEKDVQLYTAPIGNTSPLNDTFLRQRRVTPGQLHTWQSRVRDVLEESQGPWPANRRGIFVGISSMYYAAKVAGIHERLISRKDALRALEAALNKELKPEDDPFALPLAVTHLGSQLSCGSSNSKESPAELEDKGPKDFLDEKACRTHQQTVANIAITSAVIEHVLHNDAWLYFRREWRLPAVIDSIEGPTSDDNPAALGGTPAQNVVATWSLGWFLDGRQGDRLVRSASGHSGSTNPGCAVWRSSGTHEPPPLLRRRSSNLDTLKTKDTEHEKPVLKQRFSLTSLSSDLDDSSPGPLHMIPGAFCSIGHQTQRVDRRVSNTSAVGSRIGRWLQTAGEGLTQVTPSEDRGRRPNSVVPLASASEKDLK